MEQSVHDDDNNIDGGGGNDDNASEPPGEGAVNSMLVVVLLIMVTVVEVNTSIYYSLVKKLKNWRQFGAGDDFLGVDLVEFIGERSILCLDTATNG